MRVLVLKLKNQGKNWLSPCMSDLVFVIIAPAALIGSDFAFPTGYGPSRPVRLV